MNRVKNLVIDSATPIAAATTTVATIMTIRNLTGKSLGFDSHNLAGAVGLVATISIVSILAEKYDIY